MVGIFYSKNIINWGNKHVLVFKLCRQSIPDDRASADVPPVLHLPANYITALEGSLQL